MSYPEREASSGVNRKNSDFATICFCEKEHTLRETIGKVGDGERQAELNGLVNLEVSSSQ